MRQLRQKRKKKLGKRVRAPPLNRESTHRLQIQESSLQFSLMLQDVKADEISGGDVGIGIADGIGIEIVTAIVTAIEV